MSEHSSSNQTIHSTPKVQTFNEILRPLAELGDRASREHMQLLKELESVHQKFRGIESYYATSFNRALNLEKQVTETSKCWAAESSADQKIEKIAQEEAV